METQEKRFQIGKARDGRYSIIDTRQGWVKGWYETEAEAQAAVRECEAGRDLPPDQPPRQDGG